MKLLDSARAALGLLLPLLACASTAPDPPPGSKEKSAHPPPPPRVWFHQDQIEGWHHLDPDPHQPDHIFATVFAQLPSQVTVHPTENYYYWQLAVQGRSLQGNIRLAAGRRQLGELSFAYGEPTEFLGDQERAERLAFSKTFTSQHGVHLTSPDPFTTTVEYRGKHVTFHLNRLPQLPPAHFPLPPHEIFLQRTQDESGLRFHLLFNTSSHYFFWVLDPSEPIPEHFLPLAPDIVMGRRTGFVFWTQPSLGNRLVLASVRSSSLKRNDYHDGPFDQLADNFVQGEGLRPWIEKAMPWFQGRVDPWGQLTDTTPPRRVALTAHGTHDQPGDALALINTAKTLPDPIAHLSRGGRTPAPHNP